MESDAFSFSTLLMYGAGIATVLIIIYFATRYIFSIEKQLDNQQKQIEVLTQILEKLGEKQHLP